MDETMMFRITSPWSSKEGTYEQVMHWAQLWSEHLQEGQALIIKRIS